MQNLDNKIAPQINLIKLAANNKYEFDLDESLDWIKGMLLELNEHAKDHTPEELLEETSLTIWGDIEKKNKQDMGEHLLVTGEITAHYATECIRTLKPMKVDLHVPFKVCFIDEELATTEMFAETDETWVDGEVYEIYYYNKRTVNFLDMLHEQVFLNYNQYPVLDADSKLEGADQETPES
ncbi:MAG TPA: YceD family protein [Bacteriovoracaceae bacterium]|nr:YceD family protein [Bacteriovoracaceae bacterium]